MSANARNIENGSLDSTSRPRPRSERSKSEVVCRVKLLNGEIFNCSVKRKAKAEELIEQVVSHLKVAERDYFGIYYAVGDQRIFLNPTKTCARQYPDSKDSQWVLHFGVKYYVPDPGQLKDDFTKRLYCLQLLEDIKERRILLDPASTPALHLTALTMQATLGQYDPEQHGQGYTHKFLGFLYTDENDIPPDAENKLREIHQEKRELTPAESDMEFLTIAKDLPRFGKHFFQATELLDEERSVEIGVGCNGISIYHQSKLATEHTWAAVYKLLYHGKRFKIYYHPDDALLGEISKIKFDATESKWSKCIWKECMEQHAFFRLTDPGIRRRPTFIPRFSRGITIQFTGRTLAQMQKHSKQGDEDDEQQEGLEEAENGMDAAVVSPPTQDPPPQRTDSRPKPGEVDGSKTSGNAGDANSQVEDELPVALMREPSGFGFNFHGGAEYRALCVLKIVPGSAAAKNAQLWESGGLLQINGCNVENMLRGVTITAVKPADQSDGLVMRPAIKVGEEATAVSDAVIDGPSAKTPPTETAAEVLDHFRDRFIKGTASSAIMYELKHRDVISSGDVAMIERKADVTQQNQYLHECLARKCTKEALMEVCNAMTAVKGNPIMNALGEDMRWRLTGKRRSAETQETQETQEQSEAALDCTSPGCTFRAVNRAGLVNHQRQIHSPPQLIPCPYCGREFKRQGLHNHKRFCKKEPAVA